MELSCVFKVFLEMDIKDDGNGKYRYRLSENADIRYTRSCTLISSSICLFKNGPGKFYQLAFVKYESNSEILSKGMFA